MSTRSDYCLDKELPGVVLAQINAGHCHWCMRRTSDPVVGHDGFCPVPALHKALAERDLLRAEVEQLRYVLSGAP